jgi:uncharacterized membrane protein
MIRKHLRTLMAALLVATACPAGNESSQPTTSAADSAPAPAALEAGYLRGLVARRARPVFVDCNATDTLSLKSLPRALADLSAAEDTGAVFVLLEGDPGPDRQLTVNRVLYASHEPFECFADWSGFAYRATGQSPGWVAEVLGDRLTLRREGDVNSNWTGVRQDSTAERIQFVASRAGNEVRLVLRPTSCQNTTSGAWSAWTAELVDGLDQLTGCAVPGIPPGRE